MNITIKAIGTDIPSLPHNKSNLYALEIPEHTTVGEALIILSISTECAVTYMLNGNHASDDTVLKQDDEILIMRMMYGG